MTVRRSLSALALALAALSLGGLSGCGQAGATAQGIITFDNIPVDSGSVKFVAEDDPKRVAVGVIKDGKYEVDGSRGLTAGKYKVEITWVKAPPGGAKAAPPPAKKADPDATVPESKQGPGGGADNQNRTATQPADVKAGANTIDFALTSK